MENRRQFSDKQLSVISMKNPLVGLTLLVGVTGSGKSFAANLRTYGELCSLSKGQSAILTGNTRETLYRNVISELMQIDAGINDLHYVKNSYPQITTKRGAEVFCIGMNNDGSENRARGGNVEFWGGDEVNTYNKRSFEYVYGRIRGKNESGEYVFKPGLLTANPDEPDHFLLEKSGDGSIDHVIKFDFEDNPSISDADKIREDYKRVYTGIDYERMVLGRWSGDATRKIFPEFYQYQDRIVRAHKRPRKINEFVAAIDPGYADKTGYVIGYYDYLAGLYVVEHELWLHRAATKTVAEAIKAVEGAYHSVSQHGSLKIRTYSDTDLRLIADLWSDHAVDVVPTRKDNKQGVIGNVNSAILDNRLAIHPRCVNLVRQLRNGLWNKQFTQFERNEKEGHYDLVDALIYWFRNVDTVTNPYPAHEGYNPEYHVRPKTYSETPADGKPLALLADEESEF